MESRTVPAVTLAGAVFRGGRWVGLLLLGVGLVGCGGVGRRLEAVDGAVLLDGEPVAGATVTFVPAADGLLATAITRADGRFTMTTQVPGQGASPGVAAGDYAVTIVKVERPTEESIPEDDPSYVAPTSERRPAQANHLVPQAYGDRDRSGLTVSVAPGMEAVTFELSGNGPAAGS